MVKFLKTLLAFSAALFCAFSLNAQVTTSSISGIVTDETGAPLEGAVVSAVHTPTGSVYYAVANEAGQYYINGMRTGGPYEVEVSFLGMTSMKYSGITLKLGDPYEIDARLEASNELDAVIVVSQSSFNASKTGAGASFSLQQIEQMPTINRSVFDVVKFTPQASASKYGGMSIAGASSRYNSFQIDGAVANDSFGLSSDGTNGAMTGANPISFDAIEEIQVVVAPFDVRQSGFTGGGINAITKSGTNTVKGTAYAHYFDQNFIGTTPGTTDLSDPLALTSLEKEKDADGNPTGRGIRTKYEEQVKATFGFTAGAPIIKDKLFIFASAEYQTTSQPNIYSPLAGSYEGQNDRKLKSPISIDGTDHDYFDPVVARAGIDRYIQLYSLDGKDINGKTVTEGIEIQQSHKRSLNALARIDWNINKDHKLMFRYQLLDSSSENRSQGYKTYYYNNSNNDIINRTHTFVAELNSRLSDKVTNELRATAVLVNEHREVPYALPTIYTNGDNTIMDLGTHYCSYINKTLTNTYTLTDNVTVAAGRHTVTAGTHNEFYTFANAYRTYATGQYYFSTVADFFAQTPGNITANKYAYNYADPEIEGVSGPDWYAKTNAIQIGLYAQDEWKPNRNFTLTYGIRADLPVLLNKPTANKEYNENAGTYSVDPSEQVGQIPSATVLWSPRAGFRFFLDDNHKALLRGGVGLFTGRVPFVWLSNAYNNTGVETKSVTIDDKNMLAQLPITTDPYHDIVLGNRFTWYSKESDGKTASAADALNADGTLKAGYIANKGITGSSAGATINTLSRNFKYPQTFRVNLGFDYEFDNGLKLTFDGLFSKGLNNVYFRNIALDKAAVAYGASASAYALNPASGVTYYQPKTSSYKTIIALGNTNKGYSYSLSAKAEKYFGFGLYAMASYTFGHSYSANDGLSSQAASNLSTMKAVDINDPELSWSLYDIPHKVNAVVAYTSPFYGGIFRTRVSLTYTGTSGQRYSYTYKEGSDSVDLNGDGITGNTLMYIPTIEELATMKFSTATDAAKLERAIESDKYLNSHRGQWSERNAGTTKFENHFDLQIAEDIFYDKKNKRKVQLTFDLLNLTNLLNRNWGLYFASTVNRTLLEIDNLNADASGNMVPTFSFYDDNNIYLSDFYSRWRCQLGVKFTF